MENKYILKQMEVYDLPARLQVQALTQKNVKRPLA